MQFKHVSLAVADADRTAAYYTSFFGYTVTKRQERPDAVRIVLERPDHKLQLLSGGEPVPTEWRRHLAYIVETAEFDRLIETAPVLKAPYRLQAEGPRIAFLSDPDGLAIELIEAD
jgi:catechol 2,3-dioxygenase-like lactoylglutathione lyase family enzyme